MAKKNKKPGEPKSVENRKARHDYSIEDTLEVGIMLQGTEVKSIRDGNVSLAEGYVRVQEEPPALYLHAINIGIYAPAGAGQHSAVRTRKLLAHKREIKKLVRQVAQKGMTIVPLKLYFKNGRAKLLIGVGRGRGKGDKRQAIADRESKRDLDRVMSKRMG